MGRVAVPRNVSIGGGLILLSNIFRKGIMNLLWKLTDNIGKCGLHVVIERMLGTTESLTSAIQAYLGHCVTPSCYGLEKSASIGRPTRD
jgi:hypothetical protein